MIQRKMVFLILMAFLSLAKAADESFDCSDREQTDPVANQSKVSKYCFKYGVIPVTHPDSIATQSEAEVKLSRLLANLADDEIEDLSLNAQNIEKINKVLKEFNLPEIKSKNISIRPFIKEDIFWQGTPPIVGGEIRTDQFRYCFPCYDLESNTYIKGIIPANKLSLYSYSQATCTDKKCKCFGSCDLSDQIIQEESFVSLSDSNYRGNSALRRQLHSLGCQPSITFKNNSEALTSKCLISSTIAKCPQSNGIKTSGIYICTIKNVQNKPPPASNENKNTKNIR